MNDEEIERRIGTYFEINYKRILVEGGAHMLTPRALEQAREQVVHYWRKLRDVAINVTETEVKLQLPDRETPKGRKFVIEGVVDLVREGDRIRMYDIKTHYCGEVQNNRASYEGQLNLYAYIWKELRGQKLHEMGVIAMQLPVALRDAIRDNDPVRIRAALEAWNPLVDIPFSNESLDAVFDEIAQTVDAIEDGTFTAPSVERLASTEAKEGGKPIAFATLHCRNCDGRFSCSSYREYSMGKPGRGLRFDTKKYLEMAFDDGELAEWVDGNIALDLDEVFPDEDRLPAKPNPRPSKRPK